MTALDDELKKIELVIGKVLRIGVVTAAVIILLGLLLYLITGESGYAAGHYPVTFQTIFSGIFAEKAFAIIMLGLFVLILTPVLRVVVSIYSFYKEKDWLYVIITFIVLIILIISFFIGHH